MKIVWNEMIIQIQLRPTNYDRNILHYIDYGVLYVFLINVHYHKTDSNIADNMEWLYLFVLSCYFKYKVILGVDYNDRYFHNLICI